MNEMTRIGAPPESTRVRITTAQFLRMCEADVFGDDRIELIEGELELMPPPGNAHGLVQSAVLAQLFAIFDFRRVRAGMAIDLGGDTVVGCDVALLKGSSDAPGILPPTDVLLVVEVAETTIRRDLGLKRGKYAAAGIPLYWVIDRAHAIVHVHAEPIDGEYTNVCTVRFGEPLAVPGTDATLTLS